MSVESRSDRLCCCGGPQRLVERVGRRTLLLDNTAQGKDREGYVEALLTLASSAAVEDASVAWLPSAQPPQASLPAPAP